MNLRKKIPETPVTCMLLEPGEDIIYGNMEMKRWVCRVSQDELDRVDKEMNDFLKDNPVYVMTLIPHQVNTNTNLMVSSIVYRRIKKKPVVKKEDPDPEAKVNAAWDHTLDRVGD